MKKKGCFVNWLILMLSKLFIRFWFRWIFWGYLLEKKTQNMWQKVFVKTQKVVESCTSFYRILALLHCIFLFLNNRMDWKGHVAFWCLTKNATNLARFWSPNLLRERQRIWSKWLSGVFFKRPRPDFHAELHSVGTGFASGTYPYNGYRWNSI